MMATLTACSISMDTFKYNSTDKIIQSVACDAEVEVVAEAPPIIPEKAKTIKIIEPVMFDFDKFDIRADQEQIIDKVAGLMDEYPDTVLVIDAYASKEGPETYNMALSQWRAESVQAALVDRGVSEDRIKSITGKGEVGIFGEILKLNRRAVILSVE